MAILCFFLIALGFLGLTTSQGFPGPQVVRAGTTAGTEVWTASPGEPNVADRTYTVQNLGADRPRLVYNCYRMLAICQNAKAYLASVGKTDTAVFHFDKGHILRTLKTDSFGNPVLTKGGRKSYKVKNYRKDGRRNQSCPSTWIKNRCPETPQPGFFAEEFGQNEQEALMYREEIDVGGIPLIERSPNLLGRKTNKRTVNGNDVWQKTGYLLSCDEFPAATWIEGGSSPTAAKTICAPQNAACAGDSNNKGTPTEQNWQASAHGYLGDYMRGKTPKASRVDNTVDWTIFKFDFLVTTDKTTNAAVWVEVSGSRKKLKCYGPGFQRGKC